uniref:Membrane protein, palmitoylated 3a (MAGUK p55 subfamily member 3) n=1 Tax=Astatotilapia calliptera TaxID=8154 RepID=A0AAX7VQQ9_ASTCA
MKEAMPVLTAGAGLHETLALLTSQLRPDANHKEDMVFLKDVFSERSLGYLMKIHEKLRQYERQSPTPVLHSASSLAEDVAEELQSGSMSTEEKELLNLLLSPHLKAVLSVHDTVAQKNFDPVLPPLPDDFEDDLEEESVKIVRLVKNKEPLGATIRRDEATGAVIVARIMRGGAADRSGLVHVGDELREVNGVSVIHKRPDEISQLLSQSQGSITLKIIPAIKEEDRLKESKVYMRALFDYIPLEDKATPCQEAGLPFKRGDIIQVVTQDDPTWWQAKRVGDSNLRAGLIPSKQFQESLMSQNGMSSGLLIRDGLLNRPRCLFVVIVAISCWIGWIVQSQSKHKKCANCCLICLCPHNKAIHPCVVYSSAFSDSRLLVLTVPPYFLLTLFLPLSSLVLCSTAHFPRRLAYRMKMGTLPNPKSPKKSLCKFLLPRISVHLFIVTIYD